MCVRQKQVFKVNFAKILFLSNDKSQKGMHVLRYEAEVFQYFAKRFLVTIPFDHSTILDPKPLLLISQDS